MVFKNIEEKWQKEWEKEKIFESDPKSDKESFYITVAWPYPSGGMHVGHVRTYTLPDVFARYKRMKGYNVLFPMAWHVTGTPIVGAVNRLKEREEDQMHVLRDVYKVPEEDLKSIEEPMEFANYFIDNYYKNDMKKLGFSVDWRREFTTNDEHYNKFIEWQYKTLKELGLVKKGLHPVKWCLDEGNPVTTHDLLEGEEAERNKYSLIKFELEDKKVPMATLRPETVYGVTNAWINPDSDYVEAKVDDENWIISKEALEKLEHQERDVKTIESLKGSELIGEKVKNPVTDDNIIILPAKFVDPDNATGIVMSVPSHAPYDYVALKNIKEDKNRLKNYDLPIEKVQSIEPISVIDLESKGKHPAVEIVEEENIKNQDNDRLENLTEDIYKEEFHSGILNAKTREFQGKKVIEAKDQLIERFESENKFDEMFEFSEEVKCRCGGKVIVAKSESWFLDYKNQDWKRKARSLLRNMNIIPENTREDFDHTIDWLEDWPCIRNYGLGTKLPWDQDFIVEPLSDSTIYMAFYTIAHKIFNYDAESLTKEVFDYIFRGIGDPEKLSKKVSISKEGLIDLREHFEYWYPLDWRCSAKELIQNHLTFFMFHHTALFNRDKWPNGIASWGMGLLEGKKMSSSKGHVVLASDAIEEFGADTTRFFLFSNAEPWQDFDWRDKEVRSAKKSLENFMDIANEIIEMPNPDREEISLDKSDRWILNQLQKRLKETNEGLKNFQTRKASQSAFYDLMNDLRWYKRRKNYDKSMAWTLREVLENWTKMMAPFTPHIAEEIWNKLGKDKLVSVSEWPKVKEEFMDNKIEQSEEFVKNVLEDTKEILNVAKINNPEKIYYYSADSWKWKALEKLKENNGEIGPTMSDIMENPEIREMGDQVSDYVQNIAEDRYFEREILNINESDILKSASDFIKEELQEEIKDIESIEIEINPEKDPENKSRFSKPFKPAIYIE